MGIENKPNMYPGLGNKKIDEIGKLVADGILLPSDLDKAIVFSKQSQTDLPGLPKPEIKRTLRKTSEFILPESQSANSTKIEVESGTFKPYYPTDEEISNIKGKSRDLLTLVIQAQRYNIKFSPDIIRKMYPGVLDWQAKSKFNNEIAQLRKALTGSGLLIVSIKSEGKRKDETWRIQKPNSPEPITIFSNKEKPDPKTTSVDLPKPEITSKVIPFTPEEKKLPKESEEIKNLRLRAVEKILSAILDNNLDSLPKSPDKFLRKIINSKDKSNPTMEPEELDKLRRFILDSVEIIVTEVNKKHKKPQTLSNLEFQIFSRFELIVKKGKTTAEPKQIAIEMTKSIEKHFSPDPTSSPVPGSQEDKGPSSAPPKPRRSKYA